MSRYVQPRPELRALEPCPHGSVSDAELAAASLERADVLDFSASCNPLGPSPRVREALTSADALARVGRYPDDAALALREALTEATGLAAERVLLGNGSAELLWLVALAYVRPGDRALILGPTFGEYARACRVMGGELDWLVTRAEDDFRPDVDAVVERVRTSRPRLVFVCNPNNPTGTYLGPDEIGALVEAGPDTLFVVDEAYRGFVADPWPSEHLAASENVVLLRSLTKDHALAGLRLGYAAAASSAIDSLRAVRPPWSVNALAQVAGLAALSDPAHLAAARAEVHAAKRYLVDALVAAGIRVLPGAANFVLVEVGDARAFRAALLRWGCCVRDCASFGLPAFVRIGVRTRAECERLVGAIRSEVPG